MPAATGITAEQVSSSMSSSFNSPTSADAREAGHRSPAFSFADINGAAHVVPAGGPGGEAGPSSGHAAARAAARAAEAGGGSGGINSANVNVRTRPAARSEKPTKSSAANTPTPKRQPREQLGQQHYDAAADPAKMVRSDTAPNTGARDVYSTAAAAVKNQQSPQQLQRRQPAVQAGIWADQLAHRFLACPTCAKVVNDPVFITSERKMVCRRCVPFPRPSGAAAELPPNLLEVIKEIYAMGDVAPDPTTASSSSNNAAETKSPTRAGAAPQLSTNRSANNSTSHSSADAKAAAPQSERDTAATTTSAGTPAAAGASAPHPTTTRGSGKEWTSRRYKMEADQKYETSEYTAALELYSKAIKIQPFDGTTQLRFLYGNRSAAHFMAQRYADCIEDCLEVVRLEPTNTKMYARAARSAVTMGDFKKAIGLLEPLSADRMSPAMVEELAKYKAGLELFTRAQANFGTPDGDEYYSMLAAQFSETIAFRTRYAKSLIKQKQYARAISALEVTSASARPPQVCRLLAECYYQSGFERFDDARKALREAAQLDDECAELLKLINIVDLGKLKGNSNFTEKNFAAAVEHYTAALGHASSNDQILRILYCNRAAANKELGRFREGVDDCSKAIALDKDFYKAFARRARCHQCLGDHFASVQDFRRALQFDSSDRELAKELRQAECNLSKEAEREKDFYYQLGIPNTASDKEIKVKYRELSLRWHPDKCVGLDTLEKDRAEHKFKVVSEAYATLIDVAKRREYDLKVNRTASRGMGGFGGFSSTYSSFNTADNFRGRARGTGGYW